MINIKKALIEDIPSIMKFIDIHWKKGHILAVNRPFFEWMYVDQDEVHFIIAYEEEEDKVYGILGYVIYNEEEHPDISGTMWKTIKSGNPMLGTDISNFLKEITRYRESCALGLSKKALRYGKLLGGYACTLGHYYRLRDLEYYHIAVVNDKIILPYEKYNTKVMELDNFPEFETIISDELLRKRIFYKSMKYLKHRYFEHPIYTYRFFAIQGKSKEISVLIGREVAIENGAKAFRFIDYIGSEENLKGISEWLDDFMEMEGCEYVDLYNYGIPIVLLEECGLKLRSASDLNIIPNYFEPFEQKNVEISFVIPACIHIYLYKGDGDQDRPNIVK